MHAECQIKYKNLKGNFKILNQIDFNEENDDVNAIVKWMADKLKKTYIAALKEHVKLKDTSIENDLSFTFIIY